jgi:hypothetical protein
MKLPHLLSYKHKKPIFPKEVEETVQMFSLMLSLPAIVKAVDVTSDKPIAA